MTTEQTGEITQLGNLMAALLESPHCPPKVREAINAHLRDLYQRNDLMRPDMIRILYAHLTEWATEPVAEKVPEPVADEILNEIEVGNVAPTVVPQTGQASAS